MRNDIIIRKEDYFESTEDHSIDKLKVSYHTTKFSTYDRSRPYLHVQVGEYDEFNFFLELDEYRMEKLIERLKEELKRVKYGF